MSTPPIVELFQRDINAIIDKYRDQGITVSEVIGVLELIKMDVATDSLDNSEEW